MQTVDYLEDALKDIKDDPVAVIEEVEEIVRAVTECFKAVGDDQSTRVYEKYLMRIRRLKEKAQKKNKTH